MLNIGKNFFDIVQQNLLWIVGALIIWGLTVSFAKKNYIAIFSVCVIGAFILFVVADPMRVEEWGTQIGNALTR